MCLYVCVHIFLLSSFLIKREDSMYTVLHLPPPLPTHLTYPRAFLSSLCKPPTFFFKAAFHVGVVVCSAVSYGWAFGFFPQDFAIT